MLDEGINTRYPVYGEDMDDIIGILHLRDAAMLARKAEFREQEIRKVPGLLREAAFIPETKKIDSLFKEMQSEKIHMEIDGRRVWTNRRPGDHGGHFRRNRGEHHG